MAANVVEIIVTGKNLSGPAFASAETSARGLQSSFLKIGTGFALAAGVVAVEATKMATKFDSEMTRLNTQAGVSKDQIKGLSDGVLDLAGKVGESPDSLAESLYHVESAFESTGITSKQALGMVKTAAEGARVGGANLVDVTNALTAAVASGIPGVQNLGQAMGVLNATVGVGDMKMQDLADAFGTGMVATVKGFGLNITDVGAALAVFGDNNIRGAQAGTQLRMAVQALAKPVASGRAELEKLGITSGQLARDMQTGGLNKAITDLKTHMDAAGVSADQQGQIITDAFGKRAGTGVNILVGQFDRLQSKYPELEAGADQFGDAWGTTSKTTAQRIADLKAGFQALMIHIGEKLTPAVGHLADALSGVLGFISKNLNIIAPLAVAITGLVTAMLTMKLVKGIWDGASGAVRYFKDSLVGVNGRAAQAGAGLGVLAVAVTAVFVAWNSVKGQTYSVNQWKTALDNLAKTGRATGPVLDAMGKDFTNLSSSMKTADLSTISQVGDGFKEAGKSLGTFGGVVQALQNPITSLGTAILGTHQKTVQAQTDFKGMDGALADMASNGHADLAAQAFQDIADKAQTQGVSLDDLKKKFPQYGDALSGLTLQNTLTAQSMGTLGDQAITVQGKLKKQQDAADGLKQAILDLNDAERGAIDAQSNLEAAMDAASQAAGKGKDKLHEYKGELDLHTQSARDDWDALSQLAQATEDSADATMKNGGTQADATKIMESGRQQLIKNAEQMGLTKDQAQKLADKILAVPKSKSTKLNVDDSDAKKKLDAANKAKLKAKNAILTRDGLPAAKTLKGANAELLKDKKSKLSHDGSPASRTLKNTNNAKLKNKTSVLSAAAKAFWDVANPLNAWKFATKVIDVVASVGGKIESITGKIASAMGLATGGIVGGLAHGGIIGGAAGGGPRSNLTWVGEHGPELVRLPYGSQVHSNPDSMRMASEGGGGEQRIVLQIDAANNDMSRALVQILKNAIRTQHGGNVELAIGRG